MRIIRYNNPSYRAVTPALAGFPRSPWSGLETEIDRLFETALGTAAGSSATERFAIDLYEDKDSHYVRAELPGLNREDINVELVEGYLTISATQKSTTADNDPDSSSVSLSRSISIPEQVQSDAISATYENGVLTVTLPKREETKPKKVTVAVK